MRGKTAYIAILLLLSIWPPLSAWASIGEDSAMAPGRTLAHQAVKGKEVWITARHSEHDILKQEFNDPSEVTRACLSCHNQAALQFHKTIHWTWIEPISEPGKEALLGKSGLSVNNF